MGSARRGQIPEGHRWGALRSLHRSLCRPTKAMATGVALTRATASGAHRAAGAPGSWTPCPSPARRPGAKSRHLRARVLAPRSPAHLPAVGSPRTPADGPRARPSAVPRAPAPRAVEGGGGHAPAAARTVDPGGGGCSCRLRAAPAPQPAPCPRRSRPGEWPRRTPRPRCACPPQPAPPEPPPSPGDHSH